MSSIGLNRALKAYLKNTVLTQEISRQVSPFLPEKLCKGYIIQVLAQRFRKGHCEYVKAFPNEPNNVFSKEWFEWYYSRDAFKHFELDIAKIKRIRRATVLRNIEALASFQM